MPEGQIMSRRRFRMEHCKGTSIHVRHTRLLAATLLVHELGGVLQKYDHLSVGVLR